MSAQREIRCARCDKRIPNQAARIYSRWTRSYYCSDLDACARRAARRGTAKALIA